jgi:hypothetical protein
MYFFLFLLIPGSCLYIYGIIMLIKNRVKEYGVTMGGLMAHTHLSITGSILISISLVISGLLHWTVCILGGIFLIILSYSLRYIIDRKKPPD